MAEESEDASVHLRWVEDTKRLHAQRAHDRIDALHDQLNSAAVTGGNIALRTAVLINGGAAIAVLSFIGGLISQGKVGISELGAITTSLTWFAFGVALATIGMGAGYFANYSAGAMVVTSIKKWEHPYTTPGNRTQMWKVINVISQICSILAGVASVLLFVWGMFAVRHAIVHLGPLPAP